MTKNTNQSGRNELKIAVIAEQMENMSKTVDRVEKKLDQVINDSEARYARRDELNNLEEKVDSLISLRDWAVRLIVGAVILALLALIGIKS